MRLTLGGSSQGKALQISLEAIASIKGLCRFTPHPVEAYSCDPMTSMLLRPKHKISKGFSAFVGFLYIFYKRLKPQYSMRFNRLYHLCFCGLLI